LRFSAGFGGEVEDFEFARERREFDAVERNIRAEQVAQLLLKQFFEEWKHCGILCV
jgi:hypothetical protein